ncbi:MAG: TrkH family potassium uptake protein [Robiginitomaculum sp.]|nr:TrkH family potassium uptake protein [Robiginitomaculum sp.]
MKILSYACFGLSALSLISVGIAIGFSEPAAVMAFSFCGFVSGSIGVIFSLIVRGAEIQLSSRRSIILLISFWLFMPLLAMIPIMEVNASEGWVRAYIDTISHFTTTGARISQISQLPVSFGFWHAGLQWLGGYASIIMALLVLAPLNMTAPGVHRSPFLTIEKGNVAGRIKLICWSMLLVYGGLSLIILITMLVSGVDIYDAILVTMGSVSTGGYTSYGMDYQTVTGSIGSWVGLVGMMFGAMGFALHWDVIQFRASYHNDRETVGFLFLIIAAGMLFWALGQPFLSALKNSISLLTTAAVPMTKEGFSAIPTPVILALVLIGGAAVSTAGGVKIIRFIILFKQTSMDLSKLSHPSSTNSIKFKQVLITPQELVGLWAYVLGYAAVIALVVIALGFNGIEFADASSLTIISISNAGPAYISPDGLAGDFSTLSDYSLLLLGLVMVLGRVEILAAVAILSPEFWKQ